jgi:hypothetical protein
MTYNGRARLERMVPDLAKERKERYKRKLRVSLGVGLVLAGSALFLGTSIHEITDTSVYDRSNNHSTTQTSYIHLDNSLDPCPRGVVLELPINNEDAKECEREQVFLPSAYYCLTSSEE